MGAMNVPFCLWLLCCAPGPVWTMFHEVAYPWVVGPSKLNVLAAATRAMGCVLLAASERAFVSIPAWARLLRPYNLARRPVDWLPVPSNLPINIKPAEAATVRKRVSPSGGVIIGHFGSFALSVVSMLRKFLPELLRRDARRIGLLVGRGGEIFRDSLLNEHPNLAGRIHAPGALPAESAACHLAACDLLVQPYPDGASCRRSSLMAGVALGIPIVTTSGRLTEPLWEASGAVALSDAAGMVRRAEELLADEHKRAAIGHRAKAVYAEHFGIEHTVAMLRNPFLYSPGHSRGLSMPPGIPGAI
jgi:glycosyltransferase involved in cell wall biosynthesis